MDLYRKTAEVRLLKEELVFTAKELESEKNLNADFTARLVDAAVKTEKESG